MKYSNTGLKVNNNIDSLKIKRGLSTNIFTLILISLLLIFVPVTLFSTTVYADEPSLSSLLDELGFTNIAPSEIETFPAGTYKVTLLAEFALYYDINALSYYEVETTNYQTIFTGPDGEYGDTGGFTVPPVSKTFVADKEFGLSMLTAIRYFTEHSRNPDYPEEHTKVYTNLDSPTMVLIGFEDFIGGYDRDYNDMVFSIEQIYPPEIINVIRSPETPVYNQSVSVIAQVTKGSSEIESVILSYQVDLSIWTNITMNLEGTIYRADIPALPYNRQVNYKVYASDTDGYSDVSTLFSYTTIIPGRSPNALFSYSPSIVNTGEVIDFDASVSYDPDGTVVSYYWDFGDGNTGTEDIVNHSYLRSGIYSVILKVIDDEGLMGSSVVAVMVRNRAPVAAMNEMTSIINENEEVAFDASSSNDVDGTIVSYVWSFGDETAASGVTVSHIYVNSGLFNVTLTVIDNEGASDSLVQSIQVKNVDNILPVVSFSLNVETADINEVVSFDASGSFDSDGNIVSYTWDFGDGNTATGAQVDHQYNKSGVFTVKLTISDNDGATVEKTSVITITNDVINSPPVASFTVNPATVMQGESIYFDASESHDPDGTIVSYTWDFGDANSATGVTTEYAYYASGTYTITLTVTDNDGISSSIGAEITVESEPNISIAVLSGIGIGIAALVAALLYVILKRRKQKDIR